MNRSGRAGMATGETAIVAVILFVAGSLWFAGCERSRSNSIDCLRGLAAAADGKPARCPVADLPYIPGQKVACPDPKRHLHSPPRYERARLIQDLSGGIPDAEAKRRASSVTVGRNGSTSILHIRPRWWWRWLLGPLVQLLALIYLFTLFLQVRPSSRESASIIVILVIAGLGFGWMGWHSLGAESSEAIEIDPARGRVTHRRWFFGSERAPQVYEGCDGVVFVRVRGGEYSLAVLYRGSEGRTAAELVDGLAEGDVSLASGLKPGPWAISSPSSSR